MKQFLLVAMIFTLPAQAQQAVELQKGDPAPFAGVLLDEEAANVARKADQKVPLLEEKIDILKSTNAALREQTDIWRDAAEKSARAAVDARDTLTWTTAGAFVLGAAAVVLGGLAIRSAAK